MTGSGRIDHVCFNCENLQEFIDRLQRNGVEFNERQVNDGALYQLFMVEPINGIKIEVNFAYAEAERLSRKATYGGKGAVKRNRRGQIRFAASALGNRRNAQGCGSSRMVAHRLPNIHSRTA